MLPFRRLAVVLILAAISILPCGPAGAAEPAAAAGAIDRGYITPGAVLAAVAHPRRVLTAPDMELMPIEVLTAAGLKELGFDPVLIDEVLVVAEVQSPGKPPRLGAVIRFAEPPRPSGLLPELVKRTARAEIDGKPYRQASGPMDFSLMRADDRTILIAHDELLRGMLANLAKPQPGRAAELLARMQGTPDLAVVVALDPIRPMIKAEIQKNPVPPMFAGFLTIPDLIVSVEAQAKVLGGGDLSLSLRARDADAAKQLEAMLNALLDMGKMALREQINKMSQSADPVEQAGARYMDRVSGRYIDMLRPVREGDCLTLRGKGGSAQASIATTGVAVSLLLPAVQASREAARRAQSLNNLKQIILAMHNYNASFGKFPPRAIFDKQGKPLLSWRVAILPYLDQASLYQQFHLDEAWDSEHNKKLIAQMPLMYRNPSGAAPPNTANYLAVCGKGLMFDGTDGRKFAEITDGMSNTIMLVEVNDERAVSWTKPDDLEPNAANPLAGLGNAHPGGFSAAFADGHVQVLPKTINPKTFHAMLSIAGGEAVRPE